MSQNDNLPAKSSDVPAVQDKNTLPALRDTSGISLLELPKASVEVLTAAADPTEVLIRPDGIVYVPEIVVRERLDKAVGVGRWALKCEQAPHWDAECNEAYYDGSLWVMGFYVARAVGCCRWHPSNRTMSKGDALEGAKSDCLKRCTKDLGMFRDLWKPAFVRQWKAKFAHLSDGKWYLNDDLADRIVGEVYEVDSSPTPPPDALDRPKQFDRPGDGEQVNKKICPSCGGVLVKRSGKKGDFYGCANFKKRNCTYTANVADVEGSPDSPPDNADEDG